MKYSIKRWDWSNPEHLEQFACGDGFVSVDPGNDGAALGWRLGDKTPVSVCHAQDAEAVAGLMRGVSTSVLVVEAQYVNPKQIGNVLELSFRTGIMVGAVAVMRTDVNLFQVAPTTWQAHQRALNGVARKLSRVDGIALAEKVAERSLGLEQTWLGATKAQREGMASAFGIGQWWRSL